MNPQTAREQADSAEVGLFYYLRIVVALYSDPPEQAAPIQAVSRGSAFILLVLTILLIWFGVYRKTTVAGLNLALVRVSSFPHRLFWVALRTCWSGWSFGTPGFRMSRTTLA
jgi:hypothetical protein